jgi:hypothetical protein
MCRINAIALAAVLLLLLQACDVGAPRPITQVWTEDVQLDDGRVIQVNRSVTFNESNSWSGDAYNLVETAATVGFTGELATLPVWNQPLMAMVLYQDLNSHEWVLVATTSSCQAWRARNAPKPPYWEFRLKAAQWAEVPPSSGSIGRRVNLLHRYQARPHPEVDHVTIALREKLQPAHTMDRLYREVVADPDVYFCGQGNSSK